MKNRLVRFLFLAAVSTTGAVALQAAEPTILQSVDLSQVKPSPGVTVTSVEGEPALRIENFTPSPLLTRLLTIEQPAIATEFYALSGEVRYDGVVGDACLEMWSHFGPDSYFSRTLGSAGPMAKLTGTSNWRAFSLPFDAHATESHPTKLVLNLQLPGRGVVYLRKVKLSQADTVNAALAPSGAWWSDQTAGLLGGLAGATLGCVGSLLEWLAARGQAPRFVLLTVKTLIGCGAAIMVAGLAAITARQPYGVCFVLLLLGVLLVSIFPSRLRRYQSRFREAELRRMQSMDAAMP